MSQFFQRSVLASSLKELRRLVGLGRPILLTTAAITGVLWLGQSLGALQGLELAAFDQMVRLRPDRGRDPRLLIVAVTEADIGRYRLPLSDQILAKALQQIQQHKPRVVGVDIYRDVSIAPGEAALATQLRTDNVITISKLPASDEPTGTPPPQGVPKTRVGFNDIVLDADGAVRRNFAFSPDTSIKTSLAFQLALFYFAPSKLLPQQSHNDPNQVSWGKAVFQPLKPNDGGYQSVDDGGYQILLNYRTGNDIARIVSLEEVLQGKLQPGWVKDKIILVGTTAPSAKDLFFTPYSATERDHPKMSGVLIHAQMVSQFLDAVTGDRPSFWFWPGWVEIVWLGGWALFGGILAGYLRHPLHLGVASSAALLSLGGTGFALFMQSGWVPLAVPALGFVGTAASMMTYTAYQSYRTQQTIAQQAQEQEKTIALLRTLLAIPDFSTIGGTMAGTVMPTLERRSLLEGGEGIPNSPAELTLENSAAGVELSDRVTTGITKPMVRATDRPPPLLKERYRLLQVLGSGGFGMTYRAEDTLRPGHPTCVVKHLLPARQDTKFLQTARRLFKTEAEILEKLGSHDQIPQLLASFEDGDEFYLVEELIEGHPLSQELQSGEPNSQSQIINILKDSLEVLSFIHGYRVIHRDIKPSNMIRRSRDERLVLIDFGAVKQMQPPSLDELDFTIAIGTRGYSPPEQLAGHPGLNSDIYALGMIAIQAATGVRPHQLQQDPTTGTVIWRSLTSIQPELAEIIDRMVRYYFNERYQSAAEVLHDLQPFLAGRMG